MVLALCSFLRVSASRETRVVSSPPFTSTMGLSIGFVLFKVFFLLLCGVSKQSLQNDLKAVILDLLQIELINFCCPLIV